MSGRNVHTDVLKSGRRIKATICFQQRIPKLLNIHEFPMNSEVTQFVTPNIHPHRGFSFSNSKDNSGNTETALNRQYYLLPKQLQNSQIN